MLITSLAFFSCSNDTFDFEQDEIDERSLTLKSEAMVLPDSLGAILDIEETEESKALKELLEKNQMKLRSSYYGDPNYDEYFENNLWQIRDLPMMIKSRASNGGKQYLTSAGKNAEIYLNSYQRSNNVQKFYIKKYPASTSISNVIYSYSDGTPITAGYYTNNPDNKILYVKPDASGSLYSADWTITPVSTSGYVQIINNGLIAQGNSGSWYDIYYKVMGVGGSNRITFDKYVSGNAAQEFELLVQDGFTIESLEFVNEYSATITRIADGEVTDRETNHDYSPRRMDFPLAKLGNASSLFTEKKNITFSLINSREFKAKRPEIINEKLFLQPSMSSPACLNYYQAEYAENTGCPTSVPVTLPERSSVAYTYKIPAHRVSADYKLIASYRDRKVTLSGDGRG